MSVCTHVCVILMGFCSTAVSDFDDRLLCMSLPVVSVYTCECPGCIMHILFTMLRAKQVYGHTHVERKEVGISSNILEKDYS
jgi:hypothetical protein